MNVFNLNTVLDVQNALTDLARQSARNDISEKLSVKPIRDYVEDFLTQKVFSEVYSNLYERKAKRLPHNHPNALIGLYNAAIDHLERACLKQDLRDVSWPIPELKTMVMDEEMPTYWNDVAYLDEVKHWIQSLRLPELPSLKSTDYNDLSGELYDRYIDRHIKKSYADFSSAASKIKLALDKAWRSYVRWSTRHGWSGDFPVGPELLPWTDIVHACIEYKLGMKSTADPFSSLGSDMVVGYFEDDLETFQLPSQWKSSLGKLAEIKCKTVDSAIDESIANARVEVSITKAVNSPLLEELKIEAARSQAFEDSLKRAINSEAVGKIGSYEEEEYMEPDTSLNKPDLMTRSLHVPVVSYVSPRLAMVAGSSALQHRVDFVQKTSSDSSEKKKRSRIVMESGNQDDDDDGVYATMSKHSKSHIIQRLSDKVRAEFKETERFEQRLLAALEQ